MRNDKSGLLFLFSLPVITLSILLVSCDNFFIPESKIGEAQRAYNNNVLSRTAELALWHTTESHETSVETLQGQVQVLLQSDTGTDYVFI